MGATHLLFHNQGRGRPIGGGVGIPTDIAGLQLWLDGSDITTLFQDSAKTTPVTSDGDVVGAWADKSGNGNDALQATTADKPQYKTAIQNSLNVVRWNVSSDMLVVTNGILSMPYSIYFVLRLIAQPGIVDSSPCFFNNQANFLSHDGANDQIQFYNATGWFNSAHTITAGQQAIVGYVGATTETFVIKNGSSETIAAALTVSANSLEIGNRSDAPVAPNVLNGDLGEILIYDSAISANDRLVIESYLNTKWAVY